MGNKGIRNYGRCKLKEISFTNYYKAIESDGNIWRTEEPDEPSYLKVSAALKCPRSGMQGKPTLSTPVSTRRQETLESLKEIATEAVCASCPFSRMNDIQWERHRATLLEAQAERQEAQNRLNAAENEAERIRKLGEAELKEITEKYGLETVT